MLPVEVIHRLGTALSLTCFAGGIALLVGAARGRRSACRRRAALWPDREQTPPSGPLPHWRRDGRTRAGRVGIVRIGLGALGCGCLPPLVIQGWAGYGAGLALAYGAWRWQHVHANTIGKETTKAAPGTGSEVLDAHETAVAAAQLPLAADLLSACLAAGAGPCEAADAVGDSLDGPVGRRLGQVAAELRLGGEPAVVWHRLGALPGAAGLARVLSRAMETGAPAVDPVARLAADCRADRGRQATARARRAGALATAPLGLCFLPAFLLIGVAPVVIGLAEGLLTT